MDNMEVGSTTMAILFGASHPIVKYKPAIKPLSQTPSSRHMGSAQACCAGLLRSCEVAAGGGSTKRNAIDCRACAVQEEVQLQLGG